MGAFADALSELAGLTVSGVHTNFALDAVPEELSRAQLPALLTLPLVRQKYRYPDRGEGFETLAFSDGLRSVTYTVTHLLLVAPVTNGLGLRSALPELVALIDAYFAVLSASVTLNGTLLYPPKVRVECDVFKHGTTDYFGCAFRHEWVVRAEG